MQNVQKQNVIKVQAEENIKDVIDDGFSKSASLDLIESKQLQQILKRQQKQLQSRAQNKLFDNEPYQHQEVGSKRRNTYA